MGSFVGACDGSQVPHGSMMVAMTLLLWIIFDVLLLLGLTLRLVRVIVSDDIGEWWVKEPIRKRILRINDDQKRNRALDYVEGLDCPFCVGFWIAGLTLLSLYLAGGPGEANDVWRWVSAWFALNWVAAHLGARAGDTK